MGRVVPSLHIKAGSDSAAGRREERRETKGRRKRRWRTSEGQFGGGKRAHVDVLVPFPCCLHGAGAKTARARKQEKKNSQGKMKPDSKLGKEILEALKDVM